MEGRMSVNSYVKPGVCLAMAVILVDDFVDMFRSVEAGLSVYVC